MMTRNQLQSPESAASSETSEIRSINDDPLTEFTSKERKAY